MMWALIIGGAAVVLLVVLLLWAIWLLHRAQDLWWQIRQLGGRAEQLAVLVDQLQPSPPAANLDGVRDRTRDARRAAP